MPIRNNKFVDWKHKIKIKHMLGEETDEETVLKVSNYVADVIEKDKHFNNFSAQFDFRGISDVNDFNYLMSDLYDYCDDNLIWVE